MKTSELKRYYHRAKRWLIDGLIMQGYRRRFPDKLVIETTNICSLKCRCCPNGNNVGKRARGMMSREVFDRVVDNIDIPVKLCFLHMCGEPFLNPDLEYFCRKLIARKITPTIFSNGYGIDLDLLDKVLQLKGVRISFSIEAHSAQDYEHIRFPGKFDKAMASLSMIDSRFADAKRVFGLNIILTGGYAGEEIERISRKLFDAYPRLSNITFSSEWPWPALPQTGNLAGHITRHNSYCTQAKGLPAILWDGKAAFCNLDYAGKMIVGDMTTTSLSEIVNNKTSRQYRKRLAMGRLVPSSFCDNCVLPRYNSFTLDITRGKLKRKDAGKSPDLFNAADEYFKADEYFRET